jgi:hypothetical protein
MFTVSLKRRRICPGGACGRVPSGKNPHKSIGSWFELSMLLKSMAAVSSYVDARAEKKGADVGGRGAQF